MLFDMTRRYRVVCAGADLLDYADKLDAARLIAGEWQVEHDRLVVIVRQHGLPRRWKATLHDDGSVRLDRLYDDGVPDDAESRHKAAVAARIDAEERRRLRRRTAKQRAEEAAALARRKFGSGKAKVVWCISVVPWRRFDTETEAADWIGAKQPTISRACRKGYRVGSMRFKYDRDLTTQEREQHATRSVDGPRQSERAGPVHPEAPAAAR